MKQSKSVPFICQIKRIDVDQILNRIAGKINSYMFDINF